MDYAIANPSYSLKRMETVGQNIRILWEKPEFGYGRQSWDCSYLDATLDCFDRSATTLNVQPLSTWVFEDAEILYEALDGCAEALEQAAEIYSDLEERSHFCQQQLETMRCLEARLQELENQEQWYEPKQAIATLNCLICYLQERDADSFGNRHDDSYFIEGFTQLKQILSEADKQSIRFALSIS